MIRVSRSFWLWLPMAFGQLAVVSMVVIAGAGSARADEPAARWSELSIRRVTDLFSNRDLGDDDRVSSLLELLMERDAVFVDARSGKLAGASDRWLELGDYRYLMQLICFRLPPSGGPREVGALRTLVSKRDFIGTSDRRRRLASLMFRMLGSSDVDDKAATASVASEPEAVVPADLAAMAIEALSGQCPRSLVPSLVGRLGSRFYVYDRGTRLTRFPLQDAAAARLSELGLKLLRSPRPRGGSALEQGDDVVIDASSLAQVFDQWARSDSEDAIAGAVAIARWSNLSEIKDTRKRLIADETISASVRRRLASESDDARK